VKITIMGAGAWGTSIAIMLARKPLEITLWANTKKLFDELVSNRENITYFPGYTIPNQVKIEVDPLTAVKGADILISAVPGKYLRDVAREFVSHLENKTEVLSVSKGIESESSFTMSQVLMDEWKLDESRVAVLSGPNFAKEVAERMPTVNVIASKNEALALKLQSIFSSETFRVYTSSDIVGAELGGPLKNVVAIGAGIVEGLGYGDNTKSALIVRGLEEISRLFEAVGAKETTLRGLSCLGDMIATSTSNLSRNKSFGVLLGRGLTPDSAKNEVSGVGKAIEGLDSLVGLLKLANRYNVRLPIAEEIMSIVNSQITARSAIKKLMGRELKSES